MTAFQGACTHRQAKQQVPPAAQAQSVAAGTSTVQAATSDEQAGQSGSSAPAIKGAKVFRGEGVVEGIDRSIDTIQINHGDIKGYMPAMSMPYRVKDKAMLDVAKPGDKVTFVLEDTSKGAVLIEIKKAVS
jgi:Cu/Ag efflux protein CusF